MSIKNEDCYVAFIDILGFKEYVQETHPDMVYELFEKILHEKDNIERDKIFYEDKSIENQYNELSRNTYMYVMSDSIIIAIKSCYANGLPFLIKWCSKIQLKLLLNYQLTVRGGISKGIYYGDGKINFGKGMISAVNLEAKALFPRILIDPNIAEQAKKEADSCIFYRSAQVICDTDEEYYIDYLENIDWSCNKERIISFIKHNKEKTNIKNKYEWLEKKVNAKIEEYDDRVQDEIAYQEYLGYQ